MHLHRRPQPPPRPLRQSLLKDLFHHRDTEDTKDKKSTDYTDFVQGWILPVSQHAIGCGRVFFCLIAQSDQKENLRNLCNLRIIDLCVLCVLCVPDRRS
jgi:hypothetical protein